MTSKSLRYGWSASKMTSTDSTIRDSETVCVEMTGLSGSLSGIDCETVIVPLLMLTSGPKLVQFSARLTA